MSSEAALPLTRHTAPRRRALGDPTPLACTVAKAAVDAVLGGATLDAYVRWIEPDLFAALARQHSLARRAGIRPNGPVGVRRARVCRVARDAAEVSIVIEHAGRCRAVAMRLEESRRRWLVVGLQVG
ncbi:Rv3235 family protein [uncultured Demequina sp.]|uniref:Rv3235 family protein n=1 Tax=uncultured Demequina sp. TaxID=693499 RepID=UPI0025D9E1B1|nr:Rv3235 family protein [uncultured Demequina sp.]